MVRSGCLPQNHVLPGSWALDIVPGGCHQSSHHLRQNREALFGLQSTVDLKRPLCRYYRRLADAVGKDGVLLLFNVRRQG